MDKPEKGPEILRAEKKSGQDSVPEWEEDFQEESHYKQYQKLERIHHFWEKSTGFVIPPDHWETGFRGMAKVKLVSNRWSTETVMN